MSEAPTSIRIGHNEDPPDEEKPPKLRRLERLVRAVFPDCRVRPSKGSQHENGKVSVEAVFIYKHPEIVYHTPTSSFDVPFFDVSGRDHATVEDAVQEWVENEIQERKDQIDMFRRTYGWLEGVDA